jgi:hypothetical protein
MLNVVREIKVVMTFELEEMFLKQTKYNQD